MPNIEKKLPVTNSPCSSLEIVSPRRTVPGARDWPAPRLTVQAVADSVAKLVGVSDDHDAVDKATSAVRGKFGDHVAASESQPYYLDVTHPKANKGEVAKYLAELPKGPYSQDAAYDRYKAAREASVDLLLEFAPQVKNLLTPAQKRKLPQSIMNNMDAKYLKAIRSSTANFGF